MPSAKITSKGQITVPLEVRRRLGLRPGDRLSFVFTETGAVTLGIPKIPVEQLGGMLKRPGQKRLSLRQMQEGMERHMVEENERALRRGTL